MPSVYRDMDVYRNAKSTMSAEAEALCMGCMEPKGGPVCSLCGWEEGVAPASPDYLAPGTVVADAFLLGRVLGAGGFGITYLAWDPTLKRKVAIKEYFPVAFGTRGGDHRTVVAAGAENKLRFENGLRKFLDEGRSLAKFQSNPGIVSVINFFSENGTSYLVMNYEEGITFQQYLNDHGGRIDFQKALAIAMPVMDALRAVHDAGILHRDISPDNIFINRSKQIKLLDFGAAKRDMTSQDKSLQIMLKRGYSPEEQYRSNGKQGRWTDVYAIAATIYRALTGNLPPEALDRLDHDTLEPPSRLGVPVPPASERALMKALAVRAPARYRTVADFQKALSRGDNAKQTAAARDGDNLQDSEQTKAMKLSASSCRQNESGAWLQVFLCHSSADKDAVRGYSARFKANGFIPWLDEENILPGQDWESTIRRAVRESHVVIVFLSASSITKEGYVQKEIKLALDVADEKPEGTIFVIPARLGPCQVPERLRGWQWVDLFDPRGSERLLTALRSREAQLLQRSEVRQSRLPGVSPRPNPPSNPFASGGLTKTSKRRADRKWLRGDKISLAVLVVAVVGLLGIYLEVPAVADYVHEKLGVRRLVDKGGKHESRVTMQQEQLQKEDRTIGTQQQKDRASAKILIRTSVFPVRVYLDEDEDPITTLTAAEPSYTVETSVGTHKVSFRSQTFHHDTKVTLKADRPPELLLIHKDQNSKGDTLGRPGRQSVVKRPVGLHTNARVTPWALM